MLTRALIVCAATTLAVATVGCGKKMEDFTSKEYGFKARFPGKPKQESQAGPFGTTMTMFGVESNDGVFGVAIADMPIPANESQAMIQNRLEGARDGSIRNVGGTQKSSSLITLNGKHPGIEYTASITRPKTGQVRSRVFLIGKRMYMVMVMGTDSYATSSQATEFLNSFNLLE